MTSKSPTQLLRNYDQSFRNGDMSLSNNPVLFSRPLASNHRYEGKQSARNPHESSLSPRINPQHIALNMPMSSGKNLIGGRVKSRNY